MQGWEERATKTKRFPKMWGTGKKEITKKIINIVINIHRAAI